MAQARPKMAKLSLIFPPEWTGKNALSEVPLDQASQVVAKVHEGLGHVGHEKIQRFLKQSQVHIPNFKILTTQVRSRCQQCAMVDGFKKANPEQLKILCKDPGLHFSADTSRALFHTDIFL